MTVLDLILDTHNEIKKLKDAKGLHQFSELYEARRRELESKRFALEKTMSKIVTLAATGAFKIESLPSPDRIMTLLTKVAGLVDDPTKLTQGKDFKSLVDQLDILSNQLKASVERSWKSFTASYDKPNQVFLDQVARVPNCASKVAELKKLMGLLANLESSVPTTKEELEQYLDIRKNVAEAFQSLNPEQFPDEVLAFFQSSQTAGGAPWSKLTDGVLEWLRNNGLLDKLRIKIAS